MTVLSSKNRQRFLLHIAFGAGAAAVEFGMARLGLIHTDAATVAMLTAVGTAAASFLRKEAAATA